MKSYTFKLVILGEFEVGKTSLIRRYSTDTFTKDYIKTAGANFTMKKVVIDDYMIKLLLWDIAGDQHFRWIASTYIEGADGIIYVVDITRPETLPPIFDVWIPLVKKNCKKFPEIPSVLFLNKEDLSNQHTITEKEIKQKHNNFFHYPIYHTSALTGKNVENAFNFFFDYFIGEYLQVKKVVYSGEEKKS